MWAQRSRGTGHEQRPGVWEELGVFGKEATPAAGTGEGCRGPHVEGQCSGLNNGPRRFRS